METLSIKELAPYLPYGLKVLSKRHFVTYGEKTPLEVVGIAFQDHIKVPDWQYEFVLNGELMFAMINDTYFKPLLRPLSDITKPISDDENNVSYASELKLWVKVDLDYFISNPLFSDYLMVNKLFEWHFDVFGLIKKGLAIDLNTIKETVK